MPPVIEEFPSTTLVKEGHRVEFNVHVTGTPPLTFNWYHDDQLITENYAHEIMEDGSLIIFSAEESHKGTYEFIVNNSAGSIDQQVILIVTKEETDEALYENTTPQANIGPILVKDFGTFVADSHANSNDKFKLQFKVSHILISYTVLVYIINPNFIVINQSDYKYLLAIEKYNCNMIGYCHSNKYIDIIND